MPAATSPSWDSCGPPLGVAVAVLATARGRLYCAAFWPLGLIQLIFSKPRSRDAGPLDRDIHWRACPRSLPGEEGFGTYVMMDRNGHADDYGYGHDVALVDLVGVAQSSLAVGYYGSNFIV